MSLKMVVENIEDVAEGARELYQQQDDGTFRLLVDGVEDTTGLKSALEKERKARREFERRAAQLKDVDPDEYQRLKAEAEERENQKLKEEGKFEELRKKWAEDKAKQQQEYEGKLSEKDRLLNKLVLEQQIKSMAVTCGVKPSLVDDVAELILARKLVQLSEDGSIVVMGADGSPSTDDLKTFFDKSFKADRPDYYAANGSAGGGGTGGRTGKAGGGQDWKNLPPVERLQFAMQQK